MKSRRIIRKLPYKPMAHSFAIKKPLLSEKASTGVAMGKYTFEVERTATKNEVKKAVAALYKVEPVSVNIVRINRRPKSLRGIKTSAKVFKKAIVTLKKGQTIDFT